MVVITSSKLLLSKFFIAIFEVYYRRENVSVFKLRLIFPAVINN